MNCYKKFANIYDELVNKDIDYKSWVQTIEEVCNGLKVEKKDYLDLGCGTGNITELIASQFTYSWAVDLSYDMLTEAETKIRNKGMKVKFICQDIIELNLNRKFDLITCCLDSTNYILKEQSLIKYFQRVYNHLKENGIFIFDINSYYKLTEILGNNLYNYDDEDVTYIWENSLENDIVDMYLTFFVKNGEVYKRFDEEHREKAYKHEKICDLLNKSNLEIVKVMDNYEEKIIEDTTERITYVVKKRKS